MAQPPFNRRTYDAVHELHRVVAAVTGLAPDAPEIPELSAGAIACIQAMLDGMVHRHGTIVIPIKQGHIGDVGLERSDRYKIDLQIGAA